MPSDRGAAVIRSRVRSPLEAAWHDLPRASLLDRAAPACGDDDLAARLWRRAAGVATGVLAATTLGAVLGGFGALIAGGAAALFAYGLGPLVLAAEVRRFPTGRPPTASELGRHWAIAAVGAVGLTAVTMAPGGADRLVFAALFLALGGVIAAGAAVAAVVIGERLPTSAARPLAVVVPLALLGLLAWEVARGPDAATLGVVDGALLLAVVALVPLTVALAAPGTADRRTALAAVTLLAGGWAAAAIVLPQGTGAAAATGPWVLWCAALAVAAGVRWLRGPTVDHLVVAVAAGYLAVGAGWLLADRAGLEPVGFGPPFVQLTAVHFTYAGAIGTVLAWRAWQRHRGRVAVVAVAATAAAPPLIAAGFVAFGPLQIAGAVLLTVGTYAYAWLVLRHVVRAVPRGAAWLLGASAVSVIVPMLLAVQWAVGANLGTPALSIPAMAATHGVANAVGFCLLGVLGWRRAAAGAADAEVR
jgi:hypothetical protein